MERYKVTIGSKSYDTVCVMEIDSYNCDAISEKYLDRNGRTILWRRFNRDDWAIERYKKKWSEQLPKNDKLIVNGSVYVHWYDCITNVIYSTKHLSQDVNRLWEVDDGFIR